jgi:hypothetical protein
MLFGARCISNLILKIKAGALDRHTVDQIMRIFLHVKSPKVRAQLSAGLRDSLVQT